jgi:hypothetical protein
MALSRGIEHWSPTTIRKQLVKIGAKVTLETCPAFIATMPNLAQLETEKHAKKAVVSPKQ